MNRFTYQQTEWLPLNELGGVILQHEQHGCSIGEYYCIKNIKEVRKEDRPVTPKGNYAVFTEGTEMNKKPEEKLARRKR